MHSYRGEACACQQTARGTQPLTPTVWQPPWLWLPGQQAAVTRHRLPLCKKALQSTASGQNHMYKCRYNVSWSVSHCCELPLGELLSWARASNPLGGGKTCGCMARVRPGQVLPQLHHHLAIMVRLQVPSCRARHRAVSVSGLSHAYACTNLSTSMPSALRSRTVVKSCRYEQHKISSGLVSAVCSHATCSGLEQCMVPAAPVQLHCSGSSACLDVLRSFASTARVCVPNTLSCSFVFSQTGATLEMKERVVVYSGASWPSATNDHQLDSHPCRLRYFSSSII